MSNREEHRRENDALQSGEGDVGLGQDEHQFGAGGQQVQRALDGDDAPDRDITRDKSVPQGAGRQE